MAFRLTKTLPFHQYLKKFQLGVPQNKIKLTLKKVEDVFNFYKLITFNRYLFTQKNPYNFLQFIFLIKSNTKQYFLSFLGFNFFYFKTVSTGKLLSKNKLITKSLKKSSKAFKYILLFFKSINDVDTNSVAYYLFHPVNRKNLNLFYLLYKNCKINPEFIGYKNYYKKTRKTVRRIKKRIKKTLLKNHTYYV